MVIQAPKYGHTSPNVFTQAPKRRHTISEALSHTIQNAVTEGPEHSHTISEALSHMLQNVVTEGPKPGKICCKTCQYKFHKLGHVSSKT